MYITPLSPLLSVPAIDHQGAANRCWAIRQRQWGCWMPHCPLTMDPPPRGWLPRAEPNLPVTPGAMYGSPVPAHQFIHRVPRTMNARGTEDKILTPMGESAWSIVVLEVARHRSAVTVARFVSSTLPKQTSASTSERSIQVPNAATCQLHDAGTCSTSPDTRLNRKYRRGLHEPQPSSSTCSPVS